MVFQLFDFSHNLRSWPKTSWSLFVFNSKFGFSRPDLDANNVALMVSAYQEK